MVSVEVDLLKRLERLIWLIWHETCQMPPQKNLKNRTEAIPATRSTAEAASSRRQNPVPAPDKTTTFFQNLGGTPKKIFKFLEVPLTQSKKMRISLCKIGLSQNPNPLTLTIAHYSPKKRMPVKKKDLFLKVIILPLKPKKHDFFVIYHTTVSSVSPRKSSTFKPSLLHDFSFFR